MCGRAPKDNHLMGIEPPVTVMTVVSANLKVPGASLVRRWPLEKGGELVLGVAPLVSSQKVTVGYITTADHMGEITWRIDASSQGVYASQIARGQEWSHFLDPLGRDVSPYVHAAVARVAAELLRLNPGRPLGETHFYNTSTCPGCHAFRVLPSGDQVLGDAEAWVRTPSTGDLRERGLWQAEKYYCSVLGETPDDIVRLVERANEAYIRGLSTPVLPLHYAGEGCPYFLPQGTGRKGGLPAWEVPAAQVPKDNIDIIDRDGVRTLRVDAGFWRVELPIKKNVPCAYTGTNRKELMLYV